MQMDTPQKTSRPSGIPRPVSRLPLPTKSPSRPGTTSPSRDKLRADPGLDAARLTRPSEEPAFKKPYPKSPTKVQENSHIERNIPQIGTSEHGGMESELALDGTPVSETDDVVDVDVDDLESRGRSRGVRPSLSERTIETISQIPPSPASSRKSSSFFNPTSPIRSPSRAPSAYSRSPSRSSRQQSGSDLFTQSPSVSRLPSRSRISAAPQFPGNGQMDHASPDVDSPSKIKSPSAKRNFGRPALSPTKPGNTQSRTGLFSGTKKTDGTESKARPLGRKPAKPVESEEAHEQKSLNIKKTRKAAPTSGTPSAAPAQQQPGPEAKKGLKSSNALRESIAKAKAARKTAMQKSQAGSGDPWENVEDPFNQKPKDSNKGLLRKRVEAGRTSGHLNIAAMSLNELPEEVMKMYDFDPDGTTDWYESVDLVKFIAADNDLTELPDAAFPDTDPEDVDADEKGYQFGGVELLDLHGNLLRSLPSGLRKLRQLHTLNLSNNELTMADMEIVAEVESLRDLKLANNQLSGSFTPNVGRLRELQVLDLHGNSLQDLPELAELTALKVLNVSHNQLTSLPFESLSKLPLREIIASKNVLKGTLLPESVHTLEALKVLDVAGNALDKLSEHDLELLNLQNLSINANRIQHLPNMSSWKALLTLSAEDNSIGELPPGFVDLKGVRNVDLTGNDISKLDERVGLMESLVTFRIANNPLRERKFLGMNTEDLLRDLRNRCEPEPQDTDEEGSVGTQFTLAPESPIQTPKNTWQIKPGGVLDRSHSNMKEMDVEKLEEISWQDIRCLYLQHNELHQIPPALSMLAHNLVEIDLSNNPLDTTTLLSAPITLPKLQRLNLSSAGLTTLTTLLTNLSAPSLTLLDISFNRLTDTVPPLRQTYPNLTTLLATANRLTNLDFTSVQGLQVLDVSNNDIDTLPPKVGLLRADGVSENWGGGSPLRRFDVAGNRFRVPRWQVVEKGTEAVLGWLKDRIPIEELAKWEPVDEVDCF